MMFKNNGEREIIDSSKYHRMYEEFKKMASYIDNKNYDICYEMLEHSRIVMDVLTKARESANIIFGCEEK